MLELALIPASAIANRFRGGGVYRFKWEKRLEELELKLKAPVVTAGLSYEEWEEYSVLKARSKWLSRKLISGIVLASLYILLAWIDTKVLTLYTFTAFPIILMGWYARNIIGTGFLFEAIHGWTAPKWKGVLYGTARGLLTLATTIPLAYLAGNWWLAAWGSLGALQGVIYWLGGKLSKNYAVTVAEYLDGLLYGGILCLTLR